MPLQWLIREHITADFKCEIVMRVNIFSCSACAAGGKTCLCGLTARECHMVCFFNEICFYGPVPHHCALLWCGHWCWICHRSPWVSAAPEPSVHSTWTGLLKLYFSYVIIHQTLALLSGFVQISWSYCVWHFSGSRLATQIVCAQRSLLLSVKWYGQHRHSRWPFANTSITKDSESDTLNCVHSREVNS